jgi:hypothetical protein
MFFAAMISPWMLFLLAASTVQPGSFNRIGVQPARSNPRVIENRWPILVSLKCMELKINSLNEGK